MMLDFAVPPLPHDLFSMDFIFDHVCSKSGCSQVLSVRLPQCPSDSEARFTKTFSPWRYYKPSFWVLGVYCNSSFLCSTAPAVIAFGPQSLPRYHHQLGLSSYARQVVSTRLLQAIMPNRNSTLHNRFHRRISVHTFPKLPQ